MRNVEIKAKVRDLATLLSKAKILSDTPCEVIQQHDTFYNTLEGRLKLRKFELAPLTTFPLEMAPNLTYFHDPQDGSSELIYYERDDTEGPKLSSYEKADIPTRSTANLDAVLTRALGEKGIVKKHRQLYMVGQTRVHVDSVEGLGDFMELEVTLKDTEQPEDGIKIAHTLMEKLGVDHSDLIAGAYRDLLEKK